MVTPGRIAAPRRFHHLLVFLLGALLVPSAVAKPEWIRVAAEDITVLSNASAKDARTFLAGFAAYRHAFRTLIVPPGQSLAPVRILLFRRLAELREAAGPDKAGLLAFTLDVDGEVLLAMAVEGDRQDALRLAYEFDSAFGLRRLGHFLPLWVEHGTGRFFWNLRVTPDACRLGEPERGLATLLNAPAPLPWSDLSRLTAASPPYQNPAVFRAFVSQSAALMRLLLLNTPEGVRDRFLALARQLPSTPEADLAVAEVLECETSELPAKLKQSAALPPLVVPFDHDGLLARLQVAPAGELELSLCLASLLQTHPNPSDADLLLFRARTLAPSDPRVLEAWARQEDRQRNPGRAAALYREAVLAGSTNPRALLQSARLRLDEISSGRDFPGGGGAPAEEALTEVRRAILLNPGDAEAYVLLGRALFAAPQLSPEDLSALDPALRAPTFGLSVRYYRALLLQRLGQHEASVSTLREVLDDPGLAAAARQEMSASYSRLRVSWVHDRIQTLLRARDYPAALALIEDLLVPSQWPEAQEGRRELREWVEASQALDEIRDLAQEEKIEELRAAETRFIEKFPKQPATAKIREHLATLPPPPAQP